MNIKEAYQKLSAVIPGTYCIGLEVWNHKDGSGRVAIKWSVWDPAHSHQYGDTLTEAVNLAIEAHTPRAEREYPEALDQVAEELEGVELVGEIAASQGRMSNEQP
jgi:hypothetical protein